MKKRVVVMSVLAVIALFLLFSKGSFTGFDVIDLPPPPPIPGMSDDTTTTTTTTATSAVTVPNVSVPVGTNDSYSYSYIDIPTGTTLSAILARLDAIEQKIMAIDLLPSWERRLNVAEAQAASVSNMGARVDALQSQVDALNVQTQNLRAQPSVEAPFFDSLVSIESSVRRNLILSFVLFMFILFIVAGMIVLAIVNHRNDVIMNKNLIRQYLLNYQKAGYRLDALRMHLQACGWKNDFVDEVVRELPK